LPGEILAPAYNLDTLARIFDVGADAAYVGLKGYCRYEETGIDPEEVPALLKEAEKGGKKLYLAMNRIPPVGREQEFFLELSRMASLGIDGVILNDAGLVAGARKRHPDLFIMTSIGMAPLNTEEARFLRDLGANRVLLPESLSREEIRKFSEIPGITLEVFWQGEMDFTYTGKCFISSYYRYLPGGKGSAKRGGCFRVCEARYELTGKGEKKEVDISPRHFRFDGRPDPAIEAYKLTGGKPGGEEIYEVISKTAAWAGEIHKDEEVCL